MSVNRGVAAASVLLLLARLSEESAWADAPDKDRCADAYTAAQRLDRAGRLHEALDQAIVCAQSSCPGILRADCATWVGALSSRQSTIVVAVHDASGAELSDVVVTLDDARTPLADRLDGRALSVDPGAHSLHLTAADGSRRDVALVVHEGERDRLVEVAMGRQPPTVQASPGPASTASSPRFPLVAAGFGVAGVIALGSFAYFGLAGKASERDLSSRCEPRCDSRDVDAIHTKYLVADVSLAVSVVALAAGAIIALAASRHGER
jgi:hypothetical protein